MLSFTARSERGCVREKNEDRYLVPPKSGPLVFAVADGMGGHAGGEVASSLSIDTLQEHIVRFSEKSCFSSPVKLRSCLEKAVLESNEVIINEQKRNPELEGMGTTLTVASVLEEELFVAHVGDSQVHLFGEAGHCQITEDHSLVMELLKNGEIEPHEAQKHPQRHLLTRALGSSSLLTVDFYISNIQDGNVILLCTDGLTSMVEPQEIYEVVANKELEEAADQLLELAKARGGLDNITFILIHC